ncbi:MAG TPA: TRAM domain-containing protein [archaeon]|nr:TRAM domain-containing protein [archaeon]
MARFGERRGFRRFGGRSDFGERSDIPKPVNVGEEYDVEVSEVGTRGDGIARIKNFVVFIADAKKGEKIRIKIKEVRERFAIGEKMGAAEPASEEAAAEEVAKEDEVPAGEIVTEELEEETQEEE